MGDTLVDSSCLLKQQETPRGRSKVKQVVQQRLLPQHPIIKTHSVSQDAQLKSRQVTVNHLCYTLLKEKKRAFLEACTFIVYCCCHTLLPLSSAAYHTRNLKICSSGGKWLWFKSQNSAVREVKKRLSGQCVLIKACERTSNCIVQPCCSQWAHCSHVRRKGKFRTRQNANMKSVYS